jgi:hypothetical protein
VNVVSGILPFGRLDAGTIDGQQQAAVVSRNITTIRTISTSFD